MTLSSSYYAVTERSAGELCPIQDIKQNGWPLESTPIQRLLLLAERSNVNMNLLCCIMDILKLCWCDFHDCLQGEHLTRHIFSGTVEAR